MHHLMNMVNPARSADRRLPLAAVGTPSNGCDLDYALKQADGPLPGPSGAVAIARPVRPP
jgi:hypothetical protein